MMSKVGPSVQLPSTNQKMMRQPELGQKLLQLRKEKDLTQEELVDACNVSIRTIQRIEAGEVTPRTSTIKIILAALDEDISIFKHSTDQLYTDHQLAKSATWLKIAWISGIVYFIVGFPEALLDITRFEEERLGFLDFWHPSVWTSTIYTLVKIISLVTFSLMMLGFLKLGDLFNNALLKIAVYLMISIAALIVLLDIISIYNRWDEDFMTPILVAGAIALGGVAIVFGAGLIKLQDAMGKIALVAGILELAIGFFFITVILFFFSLLLMIPAIILEIVLLYKAQEYLENRRLT